jgi:hypothetical protein
MDLKISRRKYSATAVKVLSRTSDKVFEANNNRVGKEEGRTGPENRIGRRFGKRRNRNINKSKK